VVSPRDPRPLIRLAVRCRAEQAELVLDELLALAPSGVEQTDGEGWTEYAIYGAPSELPELGSLDAASGDGLVEVRSSAVADDWGERWREFHRAVAVGGRIVVRPPWIAAEQAIAELRAHQPHDEGLRADPIDLVIEPAQAFGTGAHPTTRLSLGLLVELAEQGLAAGPLLDLGAGSGVLAIAAAKLGWSPVSAVDREPAAVEASRENAAANEVELTAARLDIRDAPLEARATVVANLTAPLLSELARSLESGICPRVLICSGMLREQADSVAVRFAELGYDELARPELAAWAGLRLELE